MLGRRDEVVAAGSAGGALGAGADEAGELAEHVVRGIVGDLAGRGVGVDDGAAARARAAGVARAVLLVEDEVPDGPPCIPVSGRRRERP